MLKHITSLSPVPATVGTTKGKMMKRKYAFSASLQRRNAFFIIILQLKTKIRCFFVYFCLPPSLLFSPLQLRPTEIVHIELWRHLATYCDFFESQGRLSLWRRWQRWRAQYRKPPSAPESEKWDGFSGHTLRESGQKKPGCFSFWARREDVPNPDETGNFCQQPGQHFIRQRVRCWCHSSRSKQKTNSNLNVREAGWSVKAILLKDLVFCYLRCIKASF